MLLLSVDEVYSSCQKPAARGKESEGGHRADYKIQFRAKVGADLLYKDPLSCCPLSEQETQTHFQKSAVESLLCFCCETE